MNIIIENCQEDVTIDEGSLKALITELLHLERIETDEISIRLVSSEESARLHEEYFSDPTTTDCMTFPIDSPHAIEPLHCLGEIVICPHTALAECASHNTTLEEELSLYIVHSFLHLIGFTDISIEKRNEMREKEEIYLKHLKNQGKLLTVTKACC